MYDYVGEKKGSKKEQKFLNKIQGLVKYYLSGLYRVMCFKGDRC